MELARMDQRKVDDPRHFTGVVHVETCVSGAPADEVTLDEKGMAKTSCPAVNHTVELGIIETDCHFKIASNKVRILRTGRRRHGHRH